MKSWSHQKEHFDRAHMPEVIMNHSLRVRGEVKSIDPHAGGLRNVWKSSASVPVVCETSARITEVLNR